MKPFLILSVLWAICAASGPSQVPSSDDYGFLYWVHGWRGKLPANERLLCLQTNRYLAEFDVEKATLTRLGRIKNALPYSMAVSTYDLKMDLLPASILSLEVSVGKSVYICTGADTSSLQGLESPSRIIETGRYLQRFDIGNLAFKDRGGETLSAKGRLEVIAWPDRLQFVLEVSVPKPAVPGEVRITLETGGETIRGETPLESGSGGASGTAFLSWPPDNEKQATPNDCEVTVTPAENDASAVPVTYDQKRGWFHVNLPVTHFDMARNPEYHEKYGLRLVNRSTRPVSAPLLFALEGPFTGITGMTPMLFDKTGQPSGLPVQISKNWHRKPEAPELYEGPWFHGFAYVPLQPNEVWEGSLQIVYALWGGVPAVSHAQLCLIGWGVNQQWDQVAIGSWGESICYDPDINLNRSMIDDVRPLMVHGMGGTPETPALWTWTNNVGGGDFLTWFDPSGNRRFPEGMRTAYQRYGPNLTEAVYAGTSGDGAISMRITVSSPRCDDVNRAFHYLRYDVHKPAPFSRLAFYQLGADNYNDHQFETLARGNTEGLTEEWTFRPGGNIYDRAGIPCAGDAPWWFSAHQAIPNTPRNGAWANRGLIVRSWKARLGGEDIARPFASFFGTENGMPGMNIELSPPPGRDRLETGDYVETALELVVLPMDAKDYYGPNVNLRKDLEHNANTWKPVYRLARLNDLKVTAHQGALLRAYPLLMQADANSEARFSVQGGAGYAPCTITGLKDFPRGLLSRLDDDLQTVANSCLSENEHHQVDYNIGNGYYEVTFNLLLDTPGDRTQEIHFRYSGN